MRFGAFVPQHHPELADLPVDRHWPTMLGLARTLEQSGFEAAFVHDHIPGTPLPVPAYDTWTVLGALAATTSTIRLGQLCPSFEHRPPAYLAKAAASIDVLSGGRLEMGVGTGWSGQEPPGSRPGLTRPGGPGRLQEAVEIMTMMWTQEEVRFVGEHFRLEGAICSPRPVQQPHIPLWVAVSGERSAVRAAARHASYVHLGVTLEEFKHHSELISGLCREVGRSFDEITRAASFRVVIGDTEAEARDRLGDIKAFYRRWVEDDELERLVRFSGQPVGSAEQVIEAIRLWAEAGARYAICAFPLAAYDPSGVEHFARTVIPALSDP